MKTARSQVGKLCLLALGSALLLGACVTYPDSPPTDNPATLTAVAIWTPPAATSTQEQVPTETISPTDTPAHTQTPDPCTQFDLTSEECATHGFRNFSSTFQSMCGVSKTEDWGNGFMDIQFTDGGLTIGDNYYIRQGPNSFVATSGPNSTGEPTTIEFIAGGFVENFYTQGQLCTVITYLLIE